MRLKSTLLGAALLTAAGLAAAPANAAPIDVYVGYADSLRASGFFPSPWTTASNAVSQSDNTAINAGAKFDSGAVRIDNNTGASITISSFQVFEPNGSITYNFWSSLVIPNGDTGIFAQISTTNNAQFDTSDQGIFGGFPPAALDPNLAGNGLIGGCSSSPANVAAASETAACTAQEAVVSFSVNGGPTQSFTDTGSILTTGGWDFVNNGSFGEDGNESINWNLIGGSGGNRGGTVPEPLTLSLFGAGLAGAVALRRRRKGKSA